MSKTTRKVTVDTSRRSPIEGATGSAELSSKARKKSVFERLGTAGSSYEPDPCRSFIREDNCSYGSSSSYSHNIGTEMKKSKKEKYTESDDGDRSPESKREKRKLQDGERLKIEFKKDTLVKKKHTISALYEEEIPMRKMKKEREKREKELHAKHKMGEGVMVTKDENVRNIQIRGEERKERKSRFEGKEDEDSQSETASNKKHKKKRKHEESEEDVKEKVETIPKKRKKKKDKNRYESSSSESESEREKKKKSKKDKYKSYESEDSPSETLKKKSKSYEYDDVEDRKVATEVKRKKKKKKEKYESESDGSSERETFYGKKEKSEKIEKGHEAEKTKKVRKTVEEDIDAAKKRKGSEGKKQKSSPGPRKESHKGKDKTRRSASYSSLSSSSSLRDEEEENDDYQKKNKKRRDQDKEYRVDKRDKGRRKDKPQEERGSQLQGDGREIILDDRRKDQPPEIYQRDHHAQHQEPRYEHWERDRPVHEQSSQYGSPYYGRSRGPEPYRGRYDPSMKGGTDRERPGYRQYPDGGYGSDQARYRERGNREPYPYQTNRRSGGYGGDDEGYTGGRSRDVYAGTQESQQSYAREDKQGQRYRDHQSNRIDPDEFDERGRRKSGHRASRERKEYGSNSPVSKKRSRSPKESGRENSKDRLKAKKRKRENESPSSEKDQSVERKSKKSKDHIKSESEKDSSTEADAKAEKNKKCIDTDKREGGRRLHRDVESHQKRDDYSDEKRDRKADRSKGREKERERGSERDRDRRNKTSSAGDRSRSSKTQSKSDKKSDTPSHEETRNEKAEDRRVSALRTSNRHNSPSRRSDSDSGSKSQRRRGRSGQEGQDVNLDDVYEKISDDELDFFDEDNSKAHKPASLEDLDWSALSAIVPLSKKDSEKVQTHRSKHSGINVLKNIGFSSKLLQDEILKSIQKKFADSELQNEANVANEEFVNGTAALIANKMKSRKHRKGLIAELATQGTVLSMRKDISIRKELRIPPNRLSINYNLYCNAPTAPPDKEMFLASAALYKKIIPGESESSCKIIPSLVGSVVVCAN